METITGFNQLKKVPQLTKYAKSTQCCATGTCNSDKYLKEDSVIHNTITSKDISVFKLSDLVPKI